MILTTWPDLRRGAAARRRWPRPIQILALLVALVGAPYAASWASPVWPATDELARQRLTDPDLPPEIGVMFVEQTDALHPRRAGALLALAATSPVRAVRRAAMIRCAQRRLSACLPAARTQWRAGIDPDPDSRVAYLDVMCLFVDVEIATLLAEALHGPDPTLRAAIATSLRDAPISESARALILPALTARAADQVPSVRAAVLQTLSALDPTGRSSALLQGLDDPDPAVRASAVTALGRLADARFAPRLLDMFDAPSTPEIGLAVLGALAQTPGAEVDAALLRALASPPKHLSQSTIGAAIVRRAPFSRTTRDALLDALTDTSTAEVAFNVLAGNLSEDDLDELRARLKSPSGVRPLTRATLHTLIAANAPWRSDDGPARPAPDLAPDASLPVPSAAPRAARILAAFRDPPASRGRARLRLVRALAQAPTLPEAELRMWRYLASTDDPRGPRLLPDARAHELAHAELRRWVNDPGRAPSVRCGALWALLRLAPTDAARTAAWAFAATQLKATTEMRHCAALSLSVVPSTPGSRARSNSRVRRHIFTSALLDPDPRVRAAALLSGWLIEAADFERARRRALRDPNQHVRRLARALDVAPPRNPPRLFVVRPPNDASRPSHGWIWASLSSETRLEADANLPFPIPTLPHLKLAVLPTATRGEVSPLWRKD